MSDRTITGGVAAIAAALTLLQLFWMFGMMSPASAVGGHANGAFFGSLIAAWLWFTFALLVAAAITLLMTGGDKTHN
jgi:hypothetical protein